MGMTSYYLWHILLVRRISPVPLPLKVKGMYKDMLYKTPGSKYHGVCLKVCSPWKKYEGANCVPLKFLSFSLSLPYLPLPPSPLPVHLVLLSLSSFFFFLVKLIIVTELCRCSVHIWSVKSCITDGAQPQLQVHILRTKNGFPALQSTNY